MSNPKKLSLVFQTFVVNKRGKKRIVAFQYKTWYHEENELRVPKIRVRGSDLKNKKRLL